jgi:hypothetical protein
MAALHFPAGETATMFEREAGGSPLSAKESAWMET